MGDGQQFCAAAAAAALPPDSTAPASRGLAGAIRPRVSLSLWATGNAAPRLPQPVRTGNTNRVAEGLRDARRCDARRCDAMRRTASDRLHLRITSSLLRHFAEAAPVGQGAASSAPSCVCLDMIHRQHAETALGRRRWRLCPSSPVPAPLILLPVARCCMSSAPTRRRPPGPNRFFFSLCPGSPPPPSHFLAPAEFRWLP